MQQNEDEFDWWMNILIRENVRSYLEIGSAEGGSLVAVARVLTPRSRIVAVDTCTYNLDALRKAVTKARFAGQEVQLIDGDSTSNNVIHRVRKLGPFDACFVDANHTLDYVIKDYQNYLPHCRIMAFHDIGWKPKPGGPLIQVPEFWEHIKGLHRHEQINLNHRKNGIGVIWR